MTADANGPVFDEALALRIVECIALADQRGLTLTATHLVSALTSLESGGAVRPAKPSGMAQHLH